MALATDGPMPAESIPKYIDPLVIPPVMPHSGAGGGIMRYEIAARQFNQQVLPTSGWLGVPGAPFPMTTVWGYGRHGAAATFNSPAFTIEARMNQTVRVTWINQLVDDARGTPRFLPHLLPVDQTLHWANPPGPRDMDGQYAGPYLGPVPIVTHVHGAHVPSISDGHPEAWYLPKARDIPRGYFTQGTHYGTTQPGPAGQAVFEYPNDQRATTLWYHDHALGITRLNVYAGLAGFWLLRDDIEDGLDLPGPAPRLGDAPGTRYYEIPVAIQDRSFRFNGQLFYPDSREFFDGEEFEGPYYPDSDVPPIWNPEFFGNAIVVNGRTWPYLEVEPRLYRFRMLNGCNSRFLVLRFDQDLPFHQIGTEGGLLPGAPVVLDQLLMAPAERADVIVDFSGFEPGDEILLLNLGPDEPFGGLPIHPLAVADPETTGQVMQFRVVPFTDQGNLGEIPASLPPIEALGPAADVRDLTLNEEVSSFADVPIAAMLGTAADGPLAWDDETTEMPYLGDTEIWRLINLTEDSHPIHLHLVQFQVIDRQRFNAAQYHEAQEAWLMGMSDEPPAIDDYFIGQPSGPEPWETGWKDTVIANPGEVTRIIALFDLAGLYVWHCHILEHEDNEMMRNYEVIAPGE
jgi:FtsP/CotA-like multicopper oxidase with cupredoxin domain